MTPSKKSSAERKLGRTIGISRAVDKLTKEEVEELEELDKKTLGSYVKKASGKLASHGINMMGSLEKNDIANSAYHGRKIDTRQKGISRAVDKLTKEEFEENLLNTLDEVSSELLDRYKEKAKKSADDLYNKEKYKKSTDRWMNITKATGKQIEKTTAGIKKALNKEEVESNLLEVLDPSMGVKAYIDDFIKSDDSRFKGDTKEQRRKRAIAAFYADQKK